MTLRLGLDNQPLWPSRTFWLGLLVILVLAGALRFTGYNFSMPYVDHWDEATAWLTSMEWRGQFDALGFLNGYPPLYFWLQGLAQITLGPLGLDTVSEGVAFFRLASAAFNLVTLVVIALTARRIAGDLAGWVAGIAWGVSPLIVRYAIYAVPDPLLYLLVALSFWLAVEALNGRPSWAVWSVVAGCLAVLDKYFVVTALLPGVGVALFLARHERRLGLRLLAVQAVLIGVTGVLAGAGYLTLNNIEANDLRQHGLEWALDGGRFLFNLYNALLPAIPGVFIVYCALGGMAWLLAPRWKAQRVPALPVLLILFTILPMVWVSSLFGLALVEGRLKDVLPATVGICILLGVAVGQIVALVPARRRLAGGVAALAPLVLLVWVPQLRDSVAIVQERLLPDTRVALRQWADAAVEPGTVLVQRINHKTFNPYWGGIPYVHWFDWWETSSPLDMTVEQWRTEHGISYAAIERSVWEAMDQTAAGRAWRDAVLPLRTFSGPARGPEMTFVRLWRPQVERSAQFGDAIRLVGYDLSAEEATPGEAVMLRFYWTASMPPAANYSVFVHLVPADGDGVPVAQVDGAPASPGRPTQLWTDASETVISDLFSLTLPDGLAPGMYDIRIGLYDYATGLRLPVTDAGGASPGDSIRLTTLTVAPA